ncbi:MAG TPA: hypothetical protein ENJ31_01060 [Anaerolineae bacterium]|nr:hypothetical protein [Anaerolineae bacterium]
MVNGIAKLIAVIYLYLANFISGREFVKKVDGLVSDDQLTDLPDECQNLLMIFTNSWHFVYGMKELTTKTQVSISTKLR